MSFSSVCPDKSAIIWMIIGIVVGILLVGLALLMIWRLLTAIHDRREFKNFEKERTNARWESVSHDGSTCRMGVKGESVQNGTISLPCANLFVYHLWDGTGQA